MKRLFLITIVLFLSFDLLYGQCAMCKAVSESGGEDPEGIGSGLNTGILYLMAVPYILLFLLFRKQIFGFFKK